MTYTSEAFTRYFILRFSKKFLKQDIMKQLVIEGSVTSGSAMAKEKYFWFGSALFLTFGFSFGFLSLVTAVLITFFHSPLGFWDFFLYVPTFVSILIGLYLDFYERRSKGGQHVVLTKRRLGEAVVIGLLIGLFISIQ